MNLIFKYLYNLIFSFLHYFKPVNMFFLLVGIGMYSLQKVYNVILFSIYRLKPTSKMKTKILIKSENEVFRYSNSNTEVN